MRLSKRQIGKLMNLSWSFNADLSEIKSSWIKKNVFKLVIKRVNTGDRIYIRKIVCATTRGIRDYALLDLAEDQKERIVTQARGTAREKLLADVQQLVDTI